MDLNPEWRKPFRHLKKDEKEIAERFLAHYSLGGINYWDVHLDSPDLHFPDHWTKREIEHWKTLRAKRIDLLIVRKEDIWIFEITPKVSKAAVGGVLSYRDMFKRQYKPHKPVKVGIVVAVDDPAYHNIIDIYNIKLYVV